MAKRQSKGLDQLPGNEIIEVVKISPGSDPIKKEMTLDESRKLKNKNGVNYHRFQLGYSSFINIKKV